MDRRDREFAEFAQTRSTALRRTAFLLCGDWQRAEDIVQTALVKLYVAWHRVQRDGNIDGYVRTILTRTAIDEFRRAHRRREQLVDDPPELPSWQQDSDNAIDVQRVLDQLPSGQRAVIVLRYWEDLSITETAQTLRISEGTVKSQTAKALASMRKLLGPGSNAFEELP
ncbi:MAG TPA: SigE family RNA polymerase sigma factor [Pseudonocardiaceae bacterium]|jgi:RNA polymerase sigma-70 factor (sigma-E family)|nr:SigE family RNA polymerase sigma factor [Pseudonocardiaceae bacterium]